MKLCAEGFPKRDVPRRSLACKLHKRGIRSFSRLKPRFVGDWKWNIVISEALHNPFFDRWREHKVTLVAHCSVHSYLRRPLCTGCSYRNNGQRLYRKISRRNLDGVLSVEARVLCALKRHADTLYGVTAHGRTMQLGGVIVQRHGFAELRTCMNRSAVRFAAPSYESFDTSPQRARVQETAAGGDDVSGYTNTR